MEIPRPEARYAKWREGAVLPAMRGKEASEAPSGGRRSTSGRGYEGRETAQEGGWFRRPEIGGRRKGLNLNSLGNSERISGNGICQRRDEYRMNSRKKRLMQEYTDANAAMDTARKRMWESKEGVAYTKAMYRRRNAYQKLQEAQANNQEGIRHGQEQAENQ